MSWPRKRFAQPHLLLIINRVNFVSIKLAFNSIALITRHWFQDHWLANLGQDVISKIHLEIKGGRELTHRGSRCVSQSFQANNDIPLFLWRNESLTLRNVGWSLQGRVGPRAAVTSVSILWGRREQLLEQQRFYFRDWGRNLSVPRELGKFKVRRKSLPLKSCPDALKVRVWYPLVLFFWLLFSSTNFSATSMWFRVILCTPLDAVQPGICCVDLAGLELTEIHLPLPPNVEIKGVHHFITYFGRQTNCSNLIIKYVWIRDPEQEALFVKTVKPLLR